MVLDILNQLMEDGEFEKCLHHAEQQLLRGGYTISQLAQLNLIICRCRLGMNDPYGAVPSSLLAVKLARDVKDWDLLGRSLLNAGTACVGIRQYDQALQNFYAYFEHQVEYKGARRLEGAIWRHIGIAHQLKLESGKAIDAFNRAREWFARNKIDHSSFAVTHDLINTYFQVHETNPAASLDEIPELLQHQKRISNRNPHDSYYYSNYLLDKASYYYIQKRYGRAIVCAMQAMEVRSEDFLLTFHCHMVLHRCTLQLGNPKQAFGYALAARMAAVRGRHFDLEFVASQAMVSVIRKQGPDLVREIDEEYQSMGIDLGQYISPNFLQRAH